MIVGQGKRQESTTEPYDLIENKDEIIAGLHRLYPQNEGRGVPK